MSAPTVWEEGRLPGPRVAASTVLATALVVAADLVVTGGISALFTVGFAMVCTGAALAVRPRDFYWVGVLPPPVALLAATVLAVVHRDWVARPDDGLAQAVISALTHLATGMFMGYLLALGVLAVRQRYQRRARAARGAA